MATSFHVTDDGDRIGPKMRAAVRIVSDEGPAQSKKWVAERVGPHGSLRYGYRTVDRALRAGLLSMQVGHPAAEPRAIGALVVTEKGRRALSEADADE